MKYFAKKNGVTLIALIITIIVLLILAGVSISNLGGNNGIINNAETAKTRVERSNLQETVQTEIMLEMKKNGGHKLTVAELQDSNGILAKYFDNAQSVNLSNDEATLTAKEEYGGYVFTVRELLPDKDMFLEN